jgi:hypothetical protein
MGRQWVFAGLIVILISKAREVPIVATPETEYLEASQ